jgi:hypothetical protein
VDPILMHAIRLGKKNMDDQKKKNMCVKCPYNSVSTPGRLSTQIEDCECEKGKTKVIRHSLQYFDLCRFNLTPLGYYLYTEISSCVICPLPKTKYQCPGFHNFSVGSNIKNCITNSTAEKKKKKKTQLIC